MPTASRSRIPRWAQLTVLYTALIASLFFRLWRIDEFLTVDEHLWRERSVEFLRGLRDHDYIQTCRTEHPGVITMWAGVGGYLISERLEVANISSPLLRSMLYPSGYDEGISQSLDALWSRRIIALITWLGIVGVYLLGRRFLSPLTNLFATVLLALDPFYLAFSRLQHLDGLLACFLTLSLYALLAYCERRRRRYLLLSGAMAALATLNKAPGAFVAVGVVGILAWYGWRSRHEQAGWIKRLLVDLLLWAAAAVVIGFAFWPALWVSPSFVFKRVYDGVLLQASNPHENGNYFFGKRVADPGAFFYPVAWAMRTTPLIIVGLVGMWFTRRDDTDRRAGIALGLFAVVYGAFMTLSLKKFDRYLLPAFPLLCLPAGIGWKRIVEWLDERVRRQGWPLVATGGVTIAASLAMLLPAAPYYSAYYNPLLGGAKTAPQVLLVGWGEGLEQAAHYLNTKPDAETLNVASRSMTQFAPFLEGTWMSPGNVPWVDPDYFVTYISHVQRGYLPELEQGIEGQEAEFVARAPNGLEYAWVYRNHIHEAETEAALERVAAEPDGGLLLLNTSPSAAKYSAHQVDTIHTERNDYALTELQRYRPEHDAVWLVTYEGEHSDSSRSLTKLLSSVARPDIVIEDNGVTSARFVFAGPLAEASGQVPMSYRFGDHIEFTGYDDHSEALAPGGSLDLWLHWQATAELDASVKIFVHVMSAAGELVAQDDSYPQGDTRPTTTWYPGQIVLDEHNILLPGDLAPGEYQVYVGMYELETMQRQPIVGQDGVQMSDDRLLIATITIGS